MKIAVHGSGYVGLVQAAVTADVGHDVICVDINAKRVEQLSNGIIPIYEPGLDDLVRENIAAGRLRFTTDGAEAVNHGILQFIAVGTPSAEDGSADLSQVFATADTIGGKMQAGRVAVIKSTVPVGTGDAVADRVAAVLKSRGADNLSFDVVSNPEFLKEGSAVSDCQKPDRIIVGTRSRESEALLRELYAPFNRNHEKIIVMDRRSAELTKYAANCMLATKISFMNEMAGLAEKLGADIEHVRHGIGSDPRIGYHFIYPGIGFGGSCFPKDVSAMIHMARQSGVEPLVLEAVDNRNDAQKRSLFDKIEAEFGGDLSGRTFAFWGLAFKPNTDDMREAPSRVLMEALWEAGARVRAYDPVAMDQCRSIYGNRADLELVDSKEKALEGADALVICTEWKAFKAPDFALVKDRLSRPLVFDGRNIYDPAIMSRNGFTYHGVGRLVPPAA